MTHKTTQNYKNSVDAHASHAAYFSQSQLLRSASWTLADHDNNTLKIGNIHWYFLGTFLFVFPMSVFRDKQGLSRGRRLAEPSERRSRAPRMVCSVRSLCQTSPRISHRQSAGQSRSTCNASCTVALAGSPTRSCVMDELV